MINANNVYLTNRELEQLCDYIVDEFWENGGDVDSDKLKTLYMILRKLLNSKTISEKKYLPELERLTIYD